MEILFNVFAHPHHHNLSVCLTCLGLVFINAKAAQLEYLCLHTNRSFTLGCLQRNAHFQGLLYFRTYKPVSSILRQTPWQPEAGAGVRMLWQAYLKLVCINIWQRDLREMHEALPVSVPFPTDRDVFVTAVTLAKNNKPYYTWIVHFLGVFPLSGVLLYVSRFCMLGEFLFCPLESSIPFAMEGNGPVLLLMVGISVSANFAFPRQSWKHLIPSHLSWPYSNSDKSWQFSMDLALLEPLCVLAALSLPDTHTWMFLKLTFYHFILSIHLGLICRLCSKLGWLLWKGTNESKQSTILYGKQEEALLSHYQDGGGRGL